MLFYCCYCLPIVLLEVSAGLVTAQKRIEPVSTYKVCLRTASSEAGRMRPPPILAGPQRATAATGRGLTLIQPHSPPRGQHQVYEISSGGGKAGPYLSCTFQ